MRINKYFLFCLGEYLIGEMINKMYLTRPVSFFCESRDGVVLELPRVRLLV